VGFSAIDATAHDSPAALDDPTAPLEIASNCTNIKCGSAICLLSRIRHVASSMKPCISQVTTLSTPFEVDLDAFARAGWSAVEVWLTKLEQFLSSHSPQDARRLFEKHGLSPVAAAAQGGLIALQGDARDAHMRHFRDRLALLQELAIPTLIIVPDFPQDVSEADISNAIASLRQATELAADHGVRLALEFQKNARFCASLDTAIALVQQVDSDHLGVCLDVFHYYCGPSKFEDLGALNSRNLAWVQVSDLSGVPRELAGDSDRILPGDGDFQLLPILEHLIKLAGPEYLSLEVLNPHLWAIPADRVAQIGRQALARVLDGLGSLEPVSSSAGGV
jgi:sugar phosphate isomerase/epimerase